MNYILNLTHTDLDGVAAAVLLQKGLQLDDANLIVKFVDYENIDDQIASVLEDPKLMELFITDICPSENTCQLIQGAVAKGKKVRLFDHHVTRKWVEKYSWATFDMSKCGALLVANTYKNRDSITQKDFDFALAVDAWDRWQLRSMHRKRGEELNTLQNFFGLEGFLQKFKSNIEYDKTATVKTILEQLENNKERYVNKIVKKTTKKSRVYMDKNGSKYILVFATDYISDIGNRILNSKDFADLDYVVLTNPIHDVCSLRSRSKGNFDVAAIAKSLGGGGHKNAAGFHTNLTEIVEKKIVRLFEKD